MKLRGLQKSEKILLGLILITLAFLSERTFVADMRAKNALNETRVGELIKANADARAEEESFLRRDLASTLTFPPSSELDQAGEASAKLSSFLRELAAQESEARFRINRLGTEETQVTKDYSRTPVTLEVEATFPAIGHFLEQLEDAPFLAEVDSLEVYRVENDLRLCAAKIRIFSCAVGKP